MKKVTLNGEWRFGKAGEEQLPVVIPGSVLSGLLANEKIEDPYYRENEEPTRELFRDNYIFERSFDISEELLSEENGDLVCEGLDTIADIYINDSFVAHTENMHRTYRFPVRELLKAGENKIRINFASPLNYLENYEAADNKKIDMVAAGCIKGSQYLRKAHSMFGWDWGPQLPDCGIWRNIGFEFYSEVRITEVVTAQHHFDDKVVVDVRVVFDKAADKRYKLSTTFQHAWVGTKRLFATQAQTRSVLVNEGSSEINISFEVTEPKLWWPNDQGEQNLYDIDISLKPVGMLAGGGATATAINKIEPLQTAKLTIGLRTISISREKDEWGEEFALCVNGRKLFSMGADYIPEDCVYSRITRERQEYLISSAVRAHYNTMRVWGGGYYPSDDFYDLCDKYGLVVWQDLMYACNIYDLTDEFRENIIAETIDNVRRLRHHASLGLWCGNNEMESAWVDWGWGNRCSAYLKADYIKMFEEILPSVIKSEDSASFYWPSSPSSGGCFDKPSDENRGDVHYWDVWHGQKPFTDYLKHYFRFCSEFGFQSFPELKTVETYAPFAEDRNIFSAVMERHQKNDAANGKMLYYLSENFRYPKNFETLLYTTQILQAAAIKAGVDHWRRNRGRCMGAIYWQINDNWPVASWASIDYFGRWKALHYKAVGFFAPLTGSILKTGENKGIFDGAEAWAENESSNEVKVSLTLSLKAVDFTVLKQQKTEMMLSPYSAAKVDAIDCTVLDGMDEYSRRNTFVEAVFEFEKADGSIVKSVQTEILSPWKYMELKPANISVETAEGEDYFEISLGSRTLTPFVMMSIENADCIFEDNCFDITSAEAKVVRVMKKDITGFEPADAAELKDRLKIITLQDTYM